MTRLRNSRYFVLYAVRIRDALRTNGLIVENSTYGQPYDQCAQST
jgi:hypothetical protein